MLEMVELLVQWLPGRQFRFLVDGGYVSGQLVFSLPRKVKVVGRGRCDASLYKLPPKRNRKRRGRPRKKGARLPSPKKMSRQDSLEWERIGRE